MLIIGAKGFAKEVLEILHQNGDAENLCFYDDVNANSPENLFGRFPIISTKEQAKDYFDTISNQFTLGIGNPQLRFKLAKKFIDLKGIFTSTISKNSEIGSFNIKIAEGCNILGGVKISNEVTIGTGTMIYYNSIITHDVIIGKFCEISPDVKLLGRCVINDFVSIGTGSVIFPDVKIGSNVIIGAGAVVTKDIPDNCVAVGSPAKVIRNTN